MHSRIASQSSKAPTPITSSFGVKPQTVQTVKERNNKTPDPKFNFNLSQIPASPPRALPTKPQVNLKHHLQLAQNNPIRELQRQKQRENKIKTVNLKSFTSSSSPIPPPTKRVNSSIIARQGVKGHYTRVSRKLSPSVSDTTKSPYFNSPKRITVNKKPISIPSRKINSPLIQRKIPPKSPSFQIRNHSATPSVQTFPTSIAEAKQAILGKIAGWSQDIPGYYLLRVILGKDPISEESVPRTSANIIRGVISLIPGGERLYQQMNQTGAIDRAGAWLDKNLAKLNLTWEVVSKLIGKAWDSLSIWDFRSPSKVFGKIKKVFSPLVSRIVKFAKSAGNQLLEFILEGALKLAGPLATKVMGILKGAGQLFTNIIKDPIKFVNNLVKGLKQGFQGFVGNIWTHIKKGLIGWLTGALGGANIELPDDIFSLSGAFSLATQVLGLTFGYIRRKAVKMFGEKVVSAMEKGVSLFQTLQSGGVNALWDLVQDKMSDLKSMVIDQIKDTVVGQVIQAGIKWIIGLLNPAGALLKAGMAIYEIIVFFVNRASQIAELVQAVMQAVKAISQGAVGGAAKLVENALAKALPVAIGFLASLLGINGLAKKVQNIIKGVRKKIDGAIDKLLKKARKAFVKLVSKGKKGFNKVKAKILSWWKIDKKFKDLAGNKHRLFFKGEGMAAVLMVASNAQSFENFINSVDVQDENSRKAKTEALAIAQQIDSRKRDSVRGANDAATKKNEEKKKQDLEKLMAQLSGYAQVLFGVSQEELPESKIDFQSFTREGAELGDTMTAELLTKKGKGGSVPTTEKHNIFDKLLKRRDGGRSYYVRGHLLNHHIHGPGKWQNLTPLSQTGNKAHLGAAENTVKAAVQSGAVVKYTVKAVYGRSIPVPTDDDLKSKGIDSSKWEDLKEIRTAEKHVPQALTLSAWLLEKQENGSYNNKQQIVAGKSVINSVDTNLANYDVGEGNKKKERVSLTSDDVDTIAENTGLSNTDLKPIQDAALSVPNLYQYNQIVEKIQELDISKLEKRRLAKVVNQLNSLGNVVLK